MNILIADDEMSSCIVMRHHIVRYGSPYISLDSVHDGKTFLAHVEARCPDVIFTDIRMPGMSGLDALSELEESGKLSACSCYLMSGYSEFEYARQGIRLGVKDYLLKPVKAENVMAILQKEEEARYRGLRVKDAWKAESEERALALSLSIQNLASLIAGKDYVGLKNETDHWAQLSSRGSLPIDPAYAREKLGIDASERDGQITQLKVIGMINGNASRGRPTDRMLKFFEDHYSEFDFSLQRLASESGYSVQYVSQLFKKETGRNFIQFLTEKRITQACFLLEHTDMLVKDVALSCGYTHSNYFARLFSQEKGLSPEKWREQRQEC